MGKKLSKVRKNSLKKKEKNLLMVKKLKLKDAVCIATEV